MKKLSFIDRGPQATIQVRLKKRKYTKTWSGRKYLLKCGVFYNSWDKQRHLAFFVPDKVVPNKFLCDTRPQNFSPTRSRDKVCITCQNIFHDFEGSA